jgi:hypothetical protein
LLALLPTSIALAVLSVSTIDISMRDPQEKLPAAFTLASLAGGQAVHLLLAVLASVIIIGGLARRDHPDRSIEYWLSLPIGHGRAYAVPLLVHLVLVPLAAIAVGVVSGLLISALLVTRVESFAAWVALPWPAMLAAALSIAARLSLGIVLAMLWLAPLLGLLVLLSAWLGRWGLVVLTVGLAAGSQVLKHLLGHPHVSQWLETVFEQAMQAIAQGAPDGRGLVIQDAGEISAVLLQVPRWAMDDARHALASLASPTFVAGLVLAGGCLALLVMWRRQGAGT